MKIILCFMWFWL